MGTSFTLSLFAVLFLWSSTVNFAIVPTNFTDQSALLAFKSGITYDPNNILAHNWSIGTNFCDWTGVTCSRHRQRVTTLKLHAMGLQGTISPYLGNLSFLTILNLGHNIFHGHLPNELGFLHRLKRLILHFNQLKGSIPPSLSNCRALQEISLEFNNLTGSIPKELGMLPELNILYLGVNTLQGNIPSSLGNISTLLALALEINELSGSVPSLIFNISSLITISLSDNFLFGPFQIDMCQNSRSLVNIFLSENQFSGHIPPTICKCRELRDLELNRNSFNGSLPIELAKLSKLEVLYVNENNISGMISPTLSNLSRLQYLRVYDNQIHGNIPHELGYLTNLVILDFAFNALSGTVPHAIFNISTSEALSLEYNFLSGNLPSTIGLWLPNLEYLFLNTNNFNGTVPQNLSNSSKLTNLFLDENSFVGSPPLSLCTLQLLNALNLGVNHLTGKGENSELNLIACLTNCRFLEMLVLEYNPWKGFLPSSIGNDSTPIQIFRAKDCEIQGHIPKWFGSFKDLNYLDLSNNRLSGTITPAIGGLRSLQRLFLQQNMLQGLIPNELCHLRNLGELYLSNNLLYGLIPSCLGNLSYLQKLDLSSNKLNSSIPLSLWTHENLIFLNLSNNSLHGPIPLAVKLDVIEVLDMSLNRISGNIPAVLGSFQRMSCLNISKNRLQGVIPQSFVSLVALEFIDLSYNNLSGAIPKSLEGIKYLKQLNLSFNLLSGEIPSGGPFANFTAQSFLHNAGLCGKPTLGVRTCSHKSSRSSMKEIILRYVVPIVASLTTTIACYYMLKRSFQRVHHTRVPNQALPLLPALEWPMISYQELLRATKNFSEMNLLGAGSFGSVYKAILSDGMVVAIKILNLQMDGAFRSFDAECKVFQMARHRNLVKVISSCSNPDFRALILQYLSNGSLEKWLHSNNCFLNFHQRVSIMVDVALALEYLHYGLTESIIHCDVKPNNVLLDEEMVAHVGDFGITKILEENKNMTQTKTLGTLGYIAAEYDSEGKVSTKCDVYSYGILLLEMLTRKKPTDVMFSENLSLRQWVLATFPDNIMEIIDSNLLSMEDGSTMAKRNQILALFELGLDCCKDLAEERSNMKEVAVKIRKVKSELLPSGNRKRA